VKILFTIPHYFDAGASGARNYGSLGRDPAPRRAALVLTISALWQSFGPRQFVLHHATRKGMPANTTLRGDIDVRVCTTTDRHLLAELPHLTNRITHESTNAEPPLLGYECHRVLADNLGKYDYYCYLEDDLVLRDPLFFRKISWFNSHAPEGSLLLPNRYEYAVRGDVHKVYVDGGMRPRASKAFQNPEEQPSLAAQFLGETIRFARTWNPHSGSFFLNQKQMEHWIAQPYFLDRSTEFIGPPESAATLGAMRAFRIYKPAPECAGFLEIEHCGTAYLQVLRRKVAIPDPPAPAGT